VRQLQIATGLWIPRKHRLPKVQKPRLATPIDRQNRNPARWLIRQTHDERQGNIQPRNIPIVKMTDPPSTRSRRIVTGLSAMTCDFTRKPFVAVGSTVTRKSGASLQSEVIRQTTTDAVVLPCST
jgi:hypothetical protein